MTTLGSEFLTGASGIYKLEDFPVAEQDTLVRWDQQAQNFMIIKEGPYKLQTVLSESRGECLESNSTTAGATLGGATFMDTCADVSGQSWRIVPAGNGYVFLQSDLSIGRGECLEGNQLSASSFLQGAAFMAPCGSFSGQQWKLYPNGSHYQLQTLDAESRNECLEGNAVAATSTLEGASFMASCGSVTGQLWKLVPQ